MTHSTYPFSGLLRTAVAAAMVAGAACMADAQRIPARFSDVHNPEIPEAVTICGENIPLDRSDMYEAFDRELTSIAYTHGTTMLMIKRANRYFPEMARILDRNGVPRDILYLACVESSLNPRAYSPAKAAGFWQFIPSTAREYGLEVSDEVDERYNITKATEAACRYLKDSYRRFGNWPSVMAAYNGGNTRISSELEKQNADTSLDLYLTEETTRVSISHHGHEDNHGKPVGLRISPARRPAVSASQIPHRGCERPGSRLAKLGRAARDKLCTAARCQPMDTRQKAYQPNR